MIEQAMILAAGKGERMLPLSKDLPKPLFEINGTTLIQRHLQRLAEAGIKRVVINLHYLGDLIVQQLGHEQFGMSVIYSHEAELLETAGGIQAALPLLGDAPFIVVNGDIYTDFEFTELIDHPLECLPHLVMVANPAHHKQGDYCLGERGLLQDSGNQFFTYSGIGIYSAEFFSG